MHRRINSRRDAHAIQSDAVLSTPTRRPGAGATGTHGPVLAPTPTPNRTPSAVNVNVPLDSPVYRYGEGYGGYANGYAAAKADVGVGAGKAGGVGEVSLASVREGVEHVLAGVRDAGRLDRSVGMMLSDAELRSNFLKSCLVNVLCLLSVAVFDHLLLPAIHPSHLSPLASTRTRQIGLLFDLFWKYPAFALCFWINGSWSHTISHRALMLQHPSSRQSTAPTTSGTPGVTASSFLNKLMSSVPRLLLILNFTFISYILTYIPFVGRILSFVYACWANAYYCFDFSFSRRDWNLRAVAHHMDERLPYYFGFGMIPSICCSFGPPLINMASFALVYPFFVIQALQARPVPAAPSHTLDSPGGLSPSPSPGFNSSSNYFSSSSRPSARPHLPIFALAIRALDVFTWLERSLSRRTGRAGPVSFGGTPGGDSFGMRRFGGERAGKKHF